MAEHIEPLVIDLVAWCAVRRRGYDEVLDAWRTGCPRLTVWEEAVARGLLVTQADADGLTVNVTRAGRDLVAQVLAIRAKTGAVPPPAASGRRQLP